MSEIASAKCVDLLMIGKTGNGKSSLGNAILRREIFITSADTDSVTSKVDYEYGEFDGRILKVVDVPGVGETRLSREESTNLVMMSMEYAIKTNPEGYHAFLLVFKYGQRFTAEEHETIQFLKQFFGENFVKTFCIALMTGGDNFERDSRKTKLTFPEWCDKQTGEFKELLKECNQRIILFDNVTENEEKKDSQVADLLKMVENLASSGKRYTNAHFEAARTARDKLMIEAKEPMIRHETMRETSLILDKLNKIIDNEDLNEMMLHLDELSLRARDLYESTKIQDKGTGSLSELLGTVKNIKNQIRKEKKRAKTKVAQNEKNRKLKEAKERQYKEQMQRIKEEAEKKIKEEKIALEKANKQNEEERKKIKEKLNRQKEDQKRKDEDWKKEQAEVRRKEEEIEETRTRYEEKERQHVREMQRIKEEAEKKNAEEKIALEREKKENEEKRKKIEEQLRKQQEEQMRKEEMWRKELEEAKRKVIQEQEQDFERRRREMEKLLKEYKNVKSKNDEGWLNSLGRIIKLSAVKIGEFLVDSGTTALIHVVKNKMFKK